MFATKIPPTWNTHVHPGELFYVRYPDTWHEVTPRGSTMCFAAESADRRTLFEVGSYREDGERGSLKRYQEMLAESLRRSYPRFKLRGRRSISLRAPRDRGARDIVANGWNLTPAEESRHMECRMVDGIPCVQETYTLRRARQFFHLSFKVDRKQHRRSTRTFRLVAQSARLGIDV